MCQKFGDLPECRLKPSHPFSKVGIDLFGPYKLRFGRGGKDYHCIVFTCLTTRANMFDILPDLTSDAYLNSLLRFHARFPGIERIFSDNGTNLRGGDVKMKELQL